MLDHEGMLEDHMAGMFQPTGAKVDVGRRMIGSGDVLLRGEQYQGKKVSRKELKMASESESEESLDDDEEEGEYGSEGAESDMSES